MTFWLMDEPMQALLTDMCTNVSYMEILDLHGDEDWFLLPPPKPFVFLNIGNALLDKGTWNALHPHVRNIFTRHSINVASVNTIDQNDW